MRKSLRTALVRFKPEKQIQFAENVLPNILNKAVAVNLYKAGKRDSASIVNELNCASPARGTTYKKAKISLETPKDNQMSPDQALALLIDANLSSNQYNIIRNQAKQFNCELYPPYHKVIEAKQIVLSIRYNSE